MVTFVVIASYGAAPPLFRLARISGDARRTGTRTAAVGPRPRHPTGSRALRECRNSLGDLGSERASTTRPLEEGNNRPPARAANEKARERRAGHCESGEILAAPVVTNATSSAGAEGTRREGPPFTAALASMMLVLADGQSGVVPCRGPGGLWCCCRTGAQRAGTIGHCSQAEI